MAIDEAADETPPCVGRVALVTGASRGVGRGVAAALGTSGWTVYLTGRGPARPEDPLGAAAEAVTAHGGSGHAVVCDHHDDTRIREVVDRIVAEQGRLDLLVNNAWTNPPDFTGFTEPFWQRPVGDWDSLIGIGLRAHYVASAAAARVMVEQRSGLITNISSFGGRGYLHSVLYGMSKVGLDKMAADMAVDLHDTGVTAVSLWLGLQQTERLLSAGIESFAGFRVADAEQPGFVGRVLDAVARDPTTRRANGHTLVTAELGAAYGITNDDGHQPPSHRTAFGGGPLFPPERDEPTSGAAHVH